jgi:hypothetical protein
MLVGKAQRVRRVSAKNREARMKKVIKLLERAAVILVVSVFIMACTTIIPMDAECSCLLQTVENKIENQCSVLDGYSKPRSDGMYDLARETRRKVDEAMRDRIRSAYEKTGQ